MQCMPVSGTNYHVTLGHVCTVPSASVLQSCEEPFPSRLYVVFVNRLTPLSDV